MVIIIIVNLILLVSVNPLTLIIALPSLYTGRPNAVAVIIARRAAYITLLTVKKSNYDNKAYKTLL